jgi:hypothetical protein
MIKQVSAGGKGRGGFSGGGSGGATVFTALTDCPAAYTGSKGLFVMVKNDETGLEFFPGLVYATSANSLTFTGDTCKIESNRVSSACEALLIGSTHLTESGAIYILTNGGICAGIDTNALYSLKLNYVGYQVNFGHFRDFEIFNGKGLRLFYIDATNRELYTYAPANILPYASGPGTLIAKIGCTGDSPDTGTYYFDNQGVFNTHLDKDSNQTFTINRYGYNNSSTRYRSTDIQNGAAASMLHIQGDTGIIRMMNPLGASGLMVTMGAAVNLADSAIFAFTSDCYLNTCYNKNVDNTGLFINWTTNYVKFRDTYIGDGKGNYVFKFKTNPYLNESVEDLKVDKDLYTVQWTDWSGPTKGNPQGFSPCGLIDNTRYKIIGKEVILEIYLNGTADGTTGASITLPIAPGGVAFTSKPSLGTVFMGAGTTTIGGYVDCIPGNVSAIIYPLNSNNLWDVTGFKTFVCRVCYSIT